MILQRLRSVLLKSRLGFVLVTCAWEAERTLDYLALEETNQIRPYPVGPLQSVESNFAFCGQGCRGDHLGRGRNLGEDDPANVRGDANGRKIFVRLCQTWTLR